VFKEIARVLKPGGHLVIGELGLASREVVYEAVWQHWA
jgi:ubiquinone/menaquinone biosynthesis C-methylase UbiE